MSKQRVIIFDFDGTIADSYEYVLGFLSRKAQRKKKVTEHEEMQLRGVPMSVMAHRVGIPWWRMPFLFIEGRREMTAHLDSVELFDGITEVVKAMHARGDKLFIVSSNSKANIERYLEDHDLGQYFTAVSGGAGLTNKWRFIRRLLAQHKLPKQHAWYIGDEGRDIRAAHWANVNSVAVTWGYNNAAMLYRRKPTQIAFEQSELLEKTK